MLKWITKILFTVCFVSLCFPGLVRAQAISNEGTEFWGVFPTHEPDFDTNFHTLLANASLFITSSQYSSGTVTVGSFSQNFIVSPGSVTEIQLPRNCTYINDTESGSVLSNRAIHILVDPGKPKIVVYEHIFAGQRSAATLLLPHEALSKQYYSINYPETGTDGKNFIVVTATEPNTKIHIKKGLVDLVPGGVTLNQVNDVYEYLSDNDLSGVSVSVDTLVSGCNRFAMYSGSSGVRISSPGCESQSLDPLFQQDYPVESWGTDYGFIPFSMKSPTIVDSVRTAGQYIRILAKDASTSVKINGRTVADLNAGEFYTSPLPLTEPAYIAATHPVCVAQYALSQTCSTLHPASDNNGKSYSDPDMVILNPIEYNIKNITLYSSTREHITEQYINILIKTTAANSFTINGHAPSAPFKTFTNLSGYSFLQLNINKDSTNTYQLSANEGFNAIAYGFGPVESYSYSAGTNLAANQSLDVIQRSTELEIDSACVNDDFFFRLTLPYISPQISWQMDNRENAIIQTNPTYDILTTNGKTVYIYNLSKTNAYNHAGLHQIKIIANYTSSTGGCNTGQQQIEDTFLTIGLPSVKITIQPETCDNIIDFKDTNIDTAYKITSWSWNFGDTKCMPVLNVSHLRNPIHVYSASGTYVISLTVTSAFRCAVTVMDTIHIIKNILPDFITSNSTCIGQPVTFTDKSVAINFITAKWQWYFGDGDSLRTSSPAPVTHRFKQPGAYNVQLLLISNNGCLSDTVSKQINIQALPSPDFIAPTACITDPFAQFINKTIIENNDRPISYLWHFGDEYANQANPDISTEENPRHKYMVAQPYTATLTVHTANGCDTTIAKTFIINGASPKADFEILNSSRVCSGQPLILLDKSRVVDFGEITRLEWYFDSTKPNNKMVVDSLHTDHLYNYTYNLSTTITDSVNYTIKLLAYCGVLCVDSAIKTVSVFPATKLAFTALSNICISAPPIQLTAARELSGVKGIGKYSGSGITADGIFNPAVAGLGPHTLTYTFYSEGGCQDYISQSILVVSTPNVVPVSRLYVAEGQHITLNPQYSGNNLAYHWTPSTGLDRDTVPFPKLIATNDITYSVSISNGLCQSSGQIQITVLKKPANNTFTPNDDGINDVWNIQGLGNYNDVTVQIFNRYGTLVFYSVGYPTPWDGKYKGSPVPAGTYYYVISPKGWEKPITGVVTVIR